MRPDRISTARTVVCAILFIQFMTANCFSGNLITILNPVEAATSTNELFVEGKTEETFIKSLELTVEPFIAKNGEKPASKRILVRDGYFSEKINLFQGLNLIRISTLNGKELQVIPIFFVTEDSSLLEQEQNWGDKSQILFVSPSETKVNSTPCAFRGMATNPNIKSLDVVVLDMPDLLSPETNRQKQGIEYAKPVITNQQFAFSSNLREGLNIVLAKTYKIPAQTSSMQIKSLIYEKISPNIVLNEPEIKQNKLLISGKLINKLYGKATLKITCAAEKKSNPKNVFLQTIFNKIIDTQSDGDFSVIVPWETQKNDYIIKAFPTIYLYAGSDLATKTITQW